MPNATGTKFTGFSEGLLKGEFDFSTDDIAYALTNSEPSIESDFLSDLTEIGYEFLTDDGPGNRVIPVAAIFGDTTLASVTLDTITLTAVGGTVPTWRYLSLYNLSHANDRLICYFDYGSNIVMFDGNEFIINSDGPIIQIT